MDRTKRGKNEKKKQESPPNIITSYSFDAGLKLMKAELSILACQDRNCWRKKLDSQSQLLSHVIEKVILLF